MHKTTKKEILDIHKECLKKDDNIGAELGLKSLLQICKEIPEDDFLGYYYKAMKKEIKKEIK